MPWVSLHASEATVMQASRPYGAGTFAHKCPGSLCARSEFGAWYSVTNYHSVTNYQGAADAYLLAW